MESNTEFFQLGDNQVMAINLNESFQPAKGANGKPITKDQHLDSMFNDYHTANKLNQFPISELVSKFNIEQGSKLDKGFIAAIQKA